MKKTALTIVMVLTMCVSCAAGGNVKPEKQTPEQIIAALEKKVSDQEEQIVLLVRENALLQLRLAAPRKYDYFIQKDKEWQEKIKTNDKKGSAKKE